MEVSVPTTADASPSRQPIVIPFSVSALLNYSRHSWTVKCSPRFRAEMALASAAVAVAAEQRHRETVASVREVISSAIREDGFYRRIMPPRQISDDEPYDVIVEAVASAETAQATAASRGGMTIPFATLPTSYIRGLASNVMLVDSVDLAGDSHDEFFNVLLGEEEYDTPPPAAPTNLRVTRNARGYWLDWDHPAAGSVFFWVQEAFDDGDDWVTIAILEPTAPGLRYLVESPALGWVQYRIVAAWTDDIGDSNTASVASDTLWSDILPAQLLCDLINERFELMFPLVREFSLRAIRDRNNLMGVLVAGGYLSWPPP